MARARATSWYAEPKILGLIALVVLGIPMAVVGVKLAMSVRERMRIDALAPDVRAAYLEYLRDAASQGLRIFTGRTQGSVKQTEKHRKAGRSSVFVSWHDLDPPRAIDIKVRDRKGKLIVSPKTQYEIALYLAAIRLAESHGFRQIGFTRTGKKRYLKSGAWDPYHIEYRGPYPTISAAIADTDVRLA